MSVIKILLSIILLSTLLVANEMLSEHEKKLLDGYINAWPEKFQARSKEKIDVLPIEGKKLIITWYEIAKPSLDTQKSPSVNNKFLYNIQRIAESYVNKQGNMEYLAFSLAENCRRDFPELTKKLQDLISFSKAVDQSTGKAEAFDREEVRRFATRKIVNDIRNGQDYGVYVYEDDKLVMHAPKVNGVLQGSWKTWYANGQLRYEWPFIDGRNEGKSVFWYENGTIQEEISYKNDRKNGENKEYFENGKIKKVAVYKDDELDGKYQMYYDDGQKYREIDFVNGERNGKFLEWFRGGLLARDITYRNDKLNGVFKVNDSNGYLAKEGEFADDTSKFYREYQTTGYIGAIKLESKRINVNTVDFIEYQFRSNADDKQIVESKWIELNDKKEGIKTVYLSNGQKYYEVFYKIGLAQKYTEYDWKGDIARIDTYDSDKNISNGIEYFSNKQKNQIRSKYSYKGNVQIHYDKKNGTYLRYSEDGSLLLKEEYDSFGKIIKSENYLKTNLENIVNGYMKNRSYGIGYYWLDMEKQFGYETENGRKVLDEIVNDVKKQVVLKNSYSRAEAIEILNTIGSVIKSKKITYDYGHDNLFSKTLEKRAMDCHVISTLYETVGDKLNFPIYIVHWPEHSSVKWESKDVNIFWEATIHKEFSIDDYKRWRLVPWHAEHGLKNGGYGKSLDAKEQIGLVLYYAANEVSPREEFLKLVAKLYPMLGLKSYMSPDSWANTEKNRNIIFGENDLYNKKALGEIYSYGADRNDAKVIYYYKDCRNFPEFSGITGKFGSYMCMSSLAKAYENLGKYNDAISTYEQMIIDDPKDKKVLSKKINELRQKLIKTN